MQRVCSNSFKCNGLPQFVRSFSSTKIATGPITHIALRSRVNVHNSDPRRRLEHLIQLTTEWKLTSPQALEMRKEINFLAILDSKDFSISFKEFLAKYEDYLIVCERDLRSTDTPVIIANIQALFPDFLFSANILKVLSPSLTEEGKEIFNIHAKQFCKYGWIFRSSQEFTREKEKTIQAFMKNQECTFATEEAQECFFKTWLVHCIWIRKFGHFMEEWSDSNSCSLKFPRVGSFHFLAACGGCAGHSAH